MKNELPSYPWIWGVFGFLIKDCYCFLGTLVITLQIVMCIMGMCYLQDWKIEDFVKGISSVYQLSGRDMRNVDGSDRLCLWILVEAWWATAKQVCAGVVMGRVISSPRTQANTRNKYIPTTWPKRASTMPSFITQAPTTESLTSLCYDVGLALYL